MLAIIGGSGLTKLATLSITRREVLRTPYGEPSGALTFGSLLGHDIVFLARHGYGHTIPPHEISETKVLLTLFAGREVFRDPALPAAAAPGKTQ